MLSIRCAGMAILFTNAAGMRPIDESFEMANRLLQVTNQERLRCGLEPIGRIDSEMSRICQDHVENMATYNTFEHTVGLAPSDEQTLLDRAGHLLASASHIFENLAYHTWYPSAETRNPIAWADQAVRQFLASPDHCETMHNPCLSEIGYSSYARELDATATLIYHAVLYKKTCSAKREMIKPGCECPRTLGLLPREMQEVPEMPPKSERRFKMQKLTWAPKSSQGQRDAVNKMPPQAATPAKSAPLVQEPPKAEEGGVKINTRPVAKASQQARKDADTLTQEIQAAVIADEITGSDDQPSPTESQAQQVETKSTATGAAHRYDIMAVFSIIAVMMVA